jgi:hypothetical protein
MVGAERCQRVLRSRASPLVHTMSQIRIEEFSSARTTRGDRLVERHP